MMLCSFINHSSSLFGYASEAPSGTSISKNSKSVFLTDALIDKAFSRLFSISGATPGHSKLYKDLSFHCQ